MNYSAVSIANAALLRIGARGTISSLTEDSPNAIKVNSIWDMIFQEVLSERDWKFAKTRVQLQKFATKPAAGYCYAYTLPADFLRLVRPRENPQERRICTFDDLDGFHVEHHRNRDYPVWPREASPYVMETVASTSGSITTFTTCLLTNYSACQCPITICYIRLITDYTQLLPGFVNALTYRLAAELAIPITEDKNKQEGAMQMYMQTLNSAMAQQECDDFLQDESGNQNWVTAGRFFGRW